MEALQFLILYGIRYSDENITSLTCSPVPEILHYYRPGVFSDFVVFNITYGWGFMVNYNCEVRTHISNGWMFARLGIDCMKDYTSIMFVTVHLEVVISLVSIIYIYLVRLHNASKNNTKCLFLVLLLNEMIHRMTKNAPSPINQSFWSDINTILLK